MESVFCHGYSVIVNYKRDVACFNIHTSSSLHNLSSIKVEYALLKRHWQIMFKVVALGFKSSLFFLKNMSSGYIHLYWLHMYNKMNSLTYSISTYRSHKTTYFVSNSHGLPHKVLGEVRFLPLLMVQDHMLQDNMVLGY